MKCISRHTRYGVATLILIAMLTLSQLVFAQSDGKQTSDPKTTGEVEQAIRNFHKAFFEGDKEAVVSSIIDESFYYQQGYDLFSGKNTKARLKYEIDEAKTNGRYSYDLGDFTILMIGNDAGVATYRAEFKSLKDPNDKARYQITDTLVRRDGRWQILAEHASVVPPPAERIVAGLPIGWERSTRAPANNYVITVDNSIKHEGNASVSIKFGCGSDQDSWTALSQAIAADDYRGKRVRLSGWLRAAEAGQAGLWMRVDGDGHMLAFDNMDNRPIKGTTDWKMYSVVLNVPIEAKAILFGTTLAGKGQTWTDDLRIDVVNNSVAATDMIKLMEQAGQTSISKPTYKANKGPVNLGFEDGVVH